MRTDEMLTVQDLHDELMETIRAKDAHLAEAEKALREIEQITWQEGDGSIIKYREHLICCRHLSAATLAKLKAASAAQRKEGGK